MAQHRTTRRNTVQLGATPCNLVAQLAYALKQSQRNCRVLETLLEAQRSDLNELGQILRTVDARLEQQAPESPMAACRAPGDQCTLG